MSGLQGRRRGSAIFPAWVRRWLFPLGVLVFGATLFSMVFHDSTPSPHGSDPYSRSALGYAALVDFVGLHRPVLVSRGYAVDRSGTGNPLVLLEPPAQARPRLVATVEQAANEGVAGILVLPKWRGTRDPQHPQRVSAVELLPEQQVLAPLEDLVEALEETGYPYDDPDSEPADPDLRRPDVPSAELSWTWRLAGTPRAPAIPRAQLLADADWLVPMLGVEEGTLVGWIRDTYWLVISDPDFLNNAGLARDDNAEIALRVLLDEMQADGLVIDAALHGYEQAENIWRALLEPPLMVLTIQIALVVALLLWAGSRRFGRPIPPPPRVPPGYGALLDNGSRLLAAGGHRRESLRRYLALHVRQVGDRLGIPARLTLEERSKRLRAVGRRRGLEQDLAALYGATEPHREGRFRRGGDPQKLLRLARRIHSWRKEILDGSE